MKVQITLFLTTPPDLNLATNASGSTAIAAFASRHGLDIMNPEPTISPESGTRSGHGGGGHRTASRPHWLPVELPELSPTACAHSTGILPTSTTLSRASKAAAIPIRARRNSIVPPSAQLWILYALLRSNGLPNRCTTSPPTPFRSSRMTRFLLLGFAGCRTA